MRRQEPGLTVHVNDLTEVMYRGEICLAKPSRSAARCRHGLRQWAALPERRFNQAGLVLLVAYAASTRAWKRNQP